MTLEEKQRTQDERIKSLEQEVARLRQQQEDAPAPLPPPGYLDPRPRERPVKVVRGHAPVRTR